MLNGGISSIPFHKRHGYSEEMFNDSEIQSMKVTAAMAKGKYEESLEKIKKKSLSANKNQAAVSAKNEVKKEITQINLDPGCDDQELDDLLNLALVEKKLEKVKIESIPTNLNNSEVPLPKKAIEVKETKEDMLNWLDNILDD